MTGIEILELIGKCLAGASFLMALEYYGVGDWIENLFGNNKE